MSLLKRVETLETALLRQKENVGYEIVLKKSGETSREAVLRAGLIDWPVDRIKVICFVKSAHKAIMNEDQC